MTDKPTAHDELLDELPPLDDDGSTFDGDDDALGIAPDERDAHAVDDATLEHEPIEAWIGTSITHDERGWLDETEPDATVTPDEDVSLGEGEHGLLGEGEHGLLDDSHEGDGRDVTADEAGILHDDGSSFGDDGGAEGTGEDPSDALDRALLRDPLTVGAPDDDELEDETFYDRIEGTEREPWPSRADVAWSVERVAVDEKSPGNSSSELMATDGRFVAVAKFGEGLALSFDGGERFVQVAGCASTTAIAIVEGAPGGRALVAALWDAAKDTSALVVVRLDRGTPTAQIVAEIVAELAPTHARPSADDDEDEWSRVTSLRACVDDRRIEVVAVGRFGVLRADSARDERRATG